MTMKFLIIAVVVALTGCKPMTFEEVTAAKDYCTKHGLGAQYSTLGSRAQVSNDVYGVRCIDSQGFTYSAPTQEAK